MTGRVHTVIGDLATQRERAQAVLNKFAIKIQKETKKKEPIRIKILLNCKYHAIKKKPKYLVCRGEYVISLLNRFTQRVPYIAFINTRLFPFSPHFRSTILTTQTKKPPIFSSGGNPNSINSLNLPIDSLNLLYSHHWNPIDGRSQLAQHRTEKIGADGDEASPLLFSLIFTVYVFSFHFSLFDSVLVKP